MSDDAPKWELGPVHTGGVSIEQAGQNLRDNTEGLRQRRIGISLVVEGVDPHSAVAPTIDALVEVFEQALNLVHIKSQAYGGAWRQQGWMGNVARIMSKTARLKAMCWSDNETSVHDEPVEDTLLDQINLSAFALINRRNGNKWGDK